MPADAQNERAFQLAIQRPSAMRLLREKPLDAHRNSAPRRRKRQTNFSPATRGRAWQSLLPTPICLERMAKHKKSVVNHPSPQFRPPPTTLELHRRLGPRAKLPGAYSLQKSMAQRPASPSLFSSGLPPSKKTRRLFDTIAAAVGRTSVVAPMKTLTPLQANPRLHTLGKRPRRFPRKRNLGSLTPWQNNAGLRPSSPPTPTNLNAGRKFEKLKSRAGLHRGENW